MACLRSLFDHSRLLADDPSLCRALACASSFTSSLAICIAGAHVAGDVDWFRAVHAALASHFAVSSRVAVGSSGSAVRLRDVPVFAIRKEFQRAATRRGSGSSWEGAGAAAGYRRKSVTGGASGGPGACLRDAGGEAWPLPCG